MKKIKGKLYSFYPCWIDIEKCEPIEESWQVRYFWWMLPAFDHTFAFINSLLDRENNFPIRVKTDEYKKLMEEDENSNELGRWM